MKGKPIGKLYVSDDEKKYFQTLDGHTTDALKILKEYIIQNYDVIQQFCNRWALNNEKFLRNLYLVIYYHDIGKLTKEFQENIKTNRKSQRYPHALYGALLFWQILDEYVIEGIPLEVAAVLGHHTQLWDSLYSDKNLFEPPTFLKEEILKFIEDVHRTYLHLGFNTWFNLEKKPVELPILDERNKIKILRWIETQRNSFFVYINTQIDEKREWKKIKSIYTFMFSILKLCDDYSSANFTEYVKKYMGNSRILDDVIEDPKKFVLRLKVNSPFKVVLKNKEPYSFQKRLSNSSKYVALFAPCGRGKTEGALIWALEMLKKYHRNKIVFALPTQTTSNMMYERLKKIFGSKNVGIYHGRSFIKLKEEKEKIDEEMDEELTSEDIKSENFKGSIFFKPVTVTTIDHLIYSFVKGFSQADFACGNLQNAVIIFDEVHYYEKLTLEHLITLFSTLRKMDIPHLLMSGTFPEFMLSRLKYYEFIRDDEGVAFKPFKIRLYSTTIFDSIVFTNIIENYKKGLTQFVILNTVERAKKFYLTLRGRLKDATNEPNIMLYHSQFTYKDRAEKEKEIINRMQKKPFILVATQVIEISLDISCDIMFSEIAPPDALGQRAGRLNRAGEKWYNSYEYLLNLFAPENFYPYPKDILEKTQIYLENNPLKDVPISYIDIKKFCDEIYSDYELSKSLFEEFFRKFTIFGDHWRVISTGSEEGLKFKVRDEKIQHIDVIPKNILEKKVDSAFKVENMAKIPITYLLKDLQEGGYCFDKYIQKRGRKEKIYWVCNCPYTYDIGFDYDKKNDFKFII